MKRERLIQYRKAARMSQVALSMRVGCHQTQIGAIETGRRQPDEMTARRIASALGIPPGELREVFGEIRQSEGQAPRSAAVEIDGELYLPLREFMAHFVCSANDAYTYERDGMPVEEIGGVRMYPKNACHRWHAGEK
jgi:transcriptional regulator with XRE-family HTH domain